MTFGLPGPLMVLFGFKRRKKIPGFLRISMLALACMATLGIGAAMSGCGGSHNNSVAPGTYTVPVVLSLSGGTSQTINATVVVQ